MRKLLIIGDSFADVGPVHFHDSPAWTSILAKESGYKVINKGIGGGSMYYAVRNFNWCEAECEKIILVVTTPGRLYCPIPAAHPADESSSHHTQNLFYNELWKQKLDKTHPGYLSGVRTLDAISAFYTYVYNFEEYDYYHKLMLNDIVTRRPDTIVVPGCFPIGIPGSQNPMSLWNISDMELKHYGLNHDSISGFDARTDIRRCHMSAENNRIVAEQAKEWLKGAPVNLKLEDFKKPHEPIDDYFPYRKEWVKRWQKN